MVVKKRTAASPSIQSRFVHRTFADVLRLHEGGYTVNLLLVWLCLRMGCQTPENMVDLLNAALTMINVTENFGTFLLRLQNWHTSMGSQTPEEIRRWLKLSEPSRCWYITIRDPTDWIPVAVR